jgi:hypothetical protein
MRLAGDLANLPILRVPIIIIYGVQGPPSAPPWLTFASEPAGIGLRFGCQGGGAGAEQ